MSFDSRNSTGKNYLINISDSSQYSFDATTQEWTYTYYGKFSPGYWRIDNIINAPDGTTVNNYE